MPIISESVAQGTAITCHSAARQEHLQPWPPDFRLLGMSHRAALDPPTSEDKCQASQGVLVKSLSSNLK